MYIVHLISLSFKFYYQNQKQKKQNQNTYDLLHRKTVPALEEHWGILKRKKNKRLLNLLHQS